MLHNQNYKREAHVPAKWFLFDVEQQMMSKESTQTYMNSLGLYQKPWTYWDAHREKERGREAVMKESFNVAIFTALSA